MNEILTPAQKLEITNVLESIISWLIDLLYTIIFTLVNFLTRPDVLGAIAVLFLITIWYWWFKSKKIY